MSGPFPSSFLDLTVVMPLRSSEVRHDLTDHLRTLGSSVEVIVVDGSERAVFDRHHELWRRWCRHVPVDPALVTPMGKVGGVMTGVHLAGSDTVVIADDDVRWTVPLLAEAARRMAGCEVLRPQNWFVDRSWHTAWDTGRILINRVFGGDWPGTMVVSRSALLAAGGYRGDVMFENLELERTIKASGGRAEVALDLLVPRHGPSVRHFVGQRVRQAYDEFARPPRLAVALSILPVTLLGRRRAAAALVATSAALAEIGRRRAGGSRVFPATSVLWAPVWTVERAVTSWLAVWARLRCGGIRYRGTVLRAAASPPRAIGERRAAA